MIASLESTWLFLSALSRAEKLQKDQLTVARNPNVVNRCYIWGFVFKDPTAAAAQLIQCQPSMPEAQGSVLSIPLALVVAERHIIPTLQRQKQNDQVYQLSLSL